IRALIEEGLTTPTPEYVRCREHQDRLREEAIVLTMDDRFGRVEASVVPATIGPAPDPSTTGDPVFNFPWSYTGLPTISFPFALSTDGLPLALQLVGWSYGEPELFRVALWCEDVLRAASRAKKD
ncbi:MAG TPA: amidase, partial [Isosphaeraceae bacterium]|nr:amidase [Isosphaeraceae bacterium]